VTLRKVGELGFLFYFTLCRMSQMSSYSKFWTSSSEITGFLKGSAGDQVTGNVLVANRWVHTGVRDSGCLGRSSRGHVLETLLTEGDKKRWEWAAGDL
jgi:hypothetical protein